jgi:threonine synthase
MTNRLPSEAMQRCIEPDCRAEFALDQRIYTCANCGGLLEIVYPDRRDFHPEGLKKLWRERRSSADPRDRSGVWRFRELLPFAGETQVVSLFEGNTPCIWLIMRPRMRVALTCASNTRA